MKLLQQEFESVKNNNFQLKFKYPTEKLRKKINIVNRDMTEAEKKKVRKVDNSLAELVNDLQTGSVQLDDLNPEQLKVLKQILENKE